MSMITLTLLQIIKIFASYIVMTIFVPWIILGRKLEKCRLVEKVLIYITAGNFYMMNLVFILQLLKISNRFSLILLTVLPLALIDIKLNKRNVRGFIKNLYLYTHRFAAGHIGSRTLIRKNINIVFSKIKQAVLSMVERLRKNPLEWMLLITLFVFIFWIYGANCFYALGYNVSDLPVHNFWINYMSRKKIFVDGVYPFGFHCIIYYLHTVFNIETYVLLRLFGLVQVIYLHIVLIAFLKLCCKSKYASYFGFISYVFINIFSTVTTERFYSALPQEFGIIFILPCIYFAFRYFSERKKEVLLLKQLPKIKKNKKDIIKKRSSRRINAIDKSTWCLIIFSMNFSMTLAVHFYDTIIAGLFCIAIAICYISRIFNRKYFFRLIMWGLIAILVAVTPMAASFALGTPLQGSLKWGMNVLNGKESAGNSAGLDDSLFKESSSNDSNDEKSQSPGSVSHKNSNDKNTGAQEKKTAKASESILSKIKKVYSAVEMQINKEVVLKADFNFIIIVLIFIILIFITSIINIILKDYDYAFMTMSGAVYILFMLILLSSERLKIPQLMDVNRSKVFFAYSLPILFAFGVDSLVCIILRHVKKKDIINITSLLCCIALVICSFKFNIVKKPYFTDALETNGAICSLSNIIKTNKNKTWTIVSANDELRMAEDYGYHFELIDFLSRMENVGPYGNVRIPSHKVYFFVEKIPVDYTEKYDGSGQTVSQKGAEESLPKMNGISEYMGKNRWVVMSRMYFWAQRFKEMYPNEMQVYYEDDKFICYCIEQNEYSLYNFAINYNYNFKAKQVH